MWVLREQKRYEDDELSEKYISIWEEYVEMQDFITFGVNNQKWLENLNSASPKWVEKQNALFKEDKLRSWQKELLLAHGLIFKKASKKAGDPRHANCMARRCAEYKAFLKKHGRVPNQCIDSEKSLYMWYRGEVKAIRAGKRSAEDIRILKSLGICA